MPESNTIHGRRLADLTSAAIEGAVEELLSPYRDDLAGDTAVVVPDVHYPYHPSTGLIANPDVVGAVVSEIESMARTDVLVACRSTPVVGTAATARILGYPRLAERLEVEVVDLDEADVSVRRITLRDGPVDVAVPRLLEDATVVVVPTLRTAAETGLALGLATLARAVSPDVVTDEAVSPAVALCEPAVSLLDASYTYLGEPRKSGFLLSSADVVGIDAAVAGAVGRTPSYLDTRTVRNWQTAGVVEGVTLDDIATGLPSGTDGPAGQPDRLMRAGYRLYARVTGDAVPPQFL